MIRSNRLGDTATTDSYIWSTGDFTGSIVLGERFTSAYPNAVPRELRFGPSGLKGRVVLNAFNTSPAEWNAPVRVGYQTGSETTLQSPLYTQTPAQIGGGIVGVVPYNAYPETCEPAPGSVQSATDDTVAVRFKGYVNYTGNLGVEVWQRPAGSASGTAYSRDLTNCFDHSRLAGFAGTQIRSNVDITLPTFRNFRPGDYEVRPKSAMSSYDVNQSTILGPVSGTNHYRFTVVDPCPGDFNRDGQRNTEDLQVILGAFGTNISSTTCGHRADLNGDWAINTADLTNFLGDFGTPCSSSRPGQPLSARQLANAVSTPHAAQHAGALEGDGGDASTQQQGPTPPGPVLAALGFTSAEAYGAFVSNLTEEEFAAHIALVFSVIKQLGLD